MPKGPLGGPRPLSSCKLQYVIHVAGPTEISREEDSPFDTALKQIGKVLMAVNHLSHPSSYTIENFEISEQGPRSGLSEHETRWAITYTLKGPALAGSLAKITSTTAMIDAHRVMIEGNNEPIENKQAIRNFNIDKRLKIVSIQITCG